MNNKFFPLFDESGLSRNKDTTELNRITAFWVKSKYFCGFSKETFLMITNISNQAPSAKEP
uniref:Uncharacterized protein n=1 Tax=Romanomermis culicivorax TaxID=13658 RepID=A0A915K688_ROMCU